MPTGANLQVMPESICNKPHSHHECDSLYSLLMDEKTYLAQAEDAKSRVKHWRDQIEREKSESAIRIQNFMTDIQKEKDASGYRLHDFQSNHQIAQQRQMPDEIRSWQGRITGEEEQLQKDIRRIEESIDYEKEESEKRIDKYQDEIQKAEHDVDAALKQAAQIQHDKEKRQKMLHAIEITRRVTEDE